MANELEQDLKDYIEQPASNYEMMTHEANFEQQNIELLDALKEVLADEGEYMLPSTVDRINEVIAKNR